MKIKLTFTPDHIALIRALNFEKFDDNHYGLDNYCLWGGTYIWEQIAFILGIHDHAYPETLEDPTGPKFPPEDMERMRDLDSFMVEHLQHIEEILHQFCTEGIQPGVTYWCYDYQRLWHKEEAPKQEPSKPQKANAQEFEEGC